MTLDASFDGQSRVISFCFCFAPGSGSLPGAWFLSEFALLGNVVLQLADGDTDLLHGITVTDGDAVVSGGQTTTKTSYHKILP